MRFSDDDAFKSIGVFDSGLGGLTVVRALQDRLPDERIAYLGDTARVPYGTKSAETVARYSLLSARFLLGRDIKLLVVACNTASAFALDVLRAELPVPVLGVVEPGGVEALSATRSGRIGVIGTLGTVRSLSYARAIAALDPNARVSALACPLFVPLVEEGWLGEESYQAHQIDRSDEKSLDDRDPHRAAEMRATEATVERYLSELHRIDPDLDVLVLGCTHYPLLRPVLSRAVARLWRHPVVLVDSALAMARAVEHELQKRSLMRSSPPLEQPDESRDARRESLLQCYVTDETRFAELGARFLGRSVLAVERVDLV